jgi:DNA-binding NarL/FixJ family response regulator
MLHFEQLIRDTWNRLEPQLFKDRAELARRMKRRDSRTFSRPPRAWCLAVRACDRRITERNGCVDPDYATDPHDPAHPGRVLEHTVTLTADLLRDLCCPVTLAPGGELHDRAAKKLGITSHGLNSARISGALQTRHIKGLLGRRGHPVPIVSSREPLDACAGRNFQLPHPLWTGDAYPSARIPGDLRQTLTRVPVYASTVSRHRFADNVHPELANPPPRKRPRLPPPAPDYVWYKWSKTGEFLSEDPRYWRKHPDDPGHPPPPGSQKPKRKRAPKPSCATGSLVFRGWRWICPKCGKKVRTLFLPAPPVPLVALRGNPKFETRNPKQIQNSNTEISKPVSEFSDLDPSDPFRISDFGFRASVSGFACNECHHIRGFSTIAPNSWNELVSYFSNGLLYGNDIPQPDWFTQTIRRKLRYRPRVRAAPRRQRLRELVLAGRTSRQIAAEMNLTQLDVCSRIWQLCRDEHVPDRLALSRKYGVSDQLAPDRIERARRRRNRVRELLVEGRSNEQIATELNVKREIIWHDVHFLCREAGVKGRKQLLSQIPVSSG